MNLAPIVLFTYNRLWHTSQTVEALKCNLYADESDLYVYSDAPKITNHISQVQEVRKYLKTITGFNDVKIIERKTNYGLANNIIEGVSDVVNKYGKVIVLEDDLIISPYFLKFMNEALQYYEDISEVWHVSGWNYPIDIDVSEGTFLWRVMNCWGWATWKNRWRYFEKDIDKIIKSFSKHDINKFNIDGAENFWKQILANKNYKINTWAIFWYATIFKNKGLCLNPNQTFVRNIGMDGSGIHFNKVWNNYNADIQLVNMHNNFIFESNISENKSKLKLIKSYYYNRKVIRFINIVKGLIDKIVNRLFGVGI